MTVEKISLMEAYIIETLRSDGVTNQEFIQCTDDMINQWQKDYKDFDFHSFKSLVEDSNGFKSIIENGYQIKFITLNGLINIIRLKFDKLPERDFNQLEEGLEELDVTTEQQVILQKMLSPNWTIHSAKDTHTISIKQTN